MKTTRFLALAVVLIASGAFLAAHAQEHPAHKEHPAHAEHPPQGEKPAAEDDLLAVAEESGEFKTFLAAVDAAGLTEKLRGDGPYTIFAPTDAAFAKLPEGTVEDLLKPANKAKLAGLLANHVIPGKILSAKMKTMKAANVSGQDLDIRVVEGVATVNGARIVRPDLTAGNGVIHGIRSVILTTEPVKRVPSAPKDHPAH